MRKNKPSSVALAILIAFGLWLYVVTNVSQEDDITLSNIPVMMVGESVLAEKNLMITGISSETVSLHLSGTRSDLNKVNSSNIQIKADLSNIYEPGVKIPLNYQIVFPGDVPNNAFTVESRSPGSILVDVDYRRTKEIPVQIRWMGLRSEDYIYDTENALLDNPVITVVGPAAVADQIHHAQIEVDLSDRTESISESYRYTLCDATGEPVDAGRITTNVEEVRLDVQIQRIKEVQLSADVLYGGGVGPQNVTVKVTPETIRVSGGDAVLDELGEKLTVATINLADVEKSATVKYTLNLPEGITNHTGVTEAEVEITFNGLVTKEFTVENIQSINVPEGLKADIISTNLQVKVRGLAADINKLTAEDIVAKVDFSEAEIGTATYKATITFGEDFSGVGALKTYSVSATVQAAEE